jgi:L-lactate dehydrogenase
VIDPRAFAGLDAFTRQTGEVVRQCHASRPAREGSPVRTPGEKGLALAKKQREEGVALYPSIMLSLEPWAKKLGVAMP